MLAAIRKRALNSNWTWAVTNNWEVLHFLPECTGLAWWESKDNDGTRANAVAACGRKTVFMIPGIFSRMGLPRCKQCCKRALIAEGNGTPFNAGMGDKS